jgi:hypothetical protein
MFTDRYSTPVRERPSQSSGFETPKNQGTSKHCPSAPKKENPSSNIGNRGNLNNIRQLRLPNMNQQ